MNAASLVLRNVLDFLAWVFFGLLVFTLTFVTLGIAIVRVATIGPRAIIFALAFALAIFAFALPAFTTGRIATTTLGTRSCRI